VSDDRTEAIQSFYPRRTGLHNLVNGKRKFLETLVSKRRFGDFAAVGKVTRRRGGETSSQK